MRFHRKSRSEEAIALVIVMISIFVLAMMAWRFAWLMKIETTLARKANNEVELEWLGRSGVEYARWILMMQRSCPNEPYDALTQVWAGGSGGPCTTNTALGDVQSRVELGHGYFTWKIIDHERKYNINIAQEPILQQALVLVGVDAGEFPSLVGAIQDWIDPDNNPRIEGSETDYYQGLRPAYEAKNGPIDDLSEMLMIRGITPEIFWGPGSTNIHDSGIYQQQNQQRHRFGASSSPPAYSVGLADLFTPQGAAKMNINTASAITLQLIPGVDPTRAEAIVAARGMEDDGTPFSGPFRSVEAGYLFNRVPGLGLEIARQIGNFADVRSSVFDVEVEAHVGDSTRRFIAVLGRGPNPRDVQILSFYWQFDK